MVNLQNQCQLSVLVEILLTFDLADEVGRQKLKKFIPDIFARTNTVPVASSIVVKLMDSIGRILDDQDAGLTFVMDMLLSIIVPKTDRLIDFVDPTIVEIVNGIKDKSLILKASQLKLVMLELRDKEECANKNNDYIKLDEIAYDLMSTNKDIVHLLTDVVAAPNAIDDIKIFRLAENTKFLLKFLDNNEPKRMTHECISRCLQILHNTLKSVKSLTTNLAPLYEVSDN